MYHEEWYLRMQFPGRNNEFINSGYDICPKCMACPDTTALRGRADCGCRVKPARAARLRLEGYNDDRMLGAMEAARMRRQVPTIGQVIEAYAAEGVRTLKEDAYVRRNVNGLRRVVAFAKDLWLVHTGECEASRLERRSRMRSGLTPFPWRC